MDSPRAPQWGWAAGAADAWSPWGRAAVWAAAASAARPLFPPPLRCRAPWLPPSRRRAAAWAAAWAAFAASVRRNTCVCAAARCALLPRHSRSPRHPLLRHPHYGIAAAIPADAGPPPTQGAPPLRRPRAPRLMSLRASRSRSPPWRSAETPPRCHSAAVLPARCREAAPLPRPRRTREPLRRAAWAPPRCRVFQGMPTASRAEVRPGGASRWCVRCSRAHRVWLQAHLLAAPAATRRAAAR